jgi:hypothetical protein
MLPKTVQLCPSCAVLERESSQAMKTWHALEHSIAEVRSRQAAHMAAHQAFDRFIEQMNCCKKCHEIKARVNAGGGVCLEISIFDDGKLNNPAAQNATGKRCNKG